MRGTFTHNNLDFVEDVLHLADEGFEQISVEPVVADPNEPYAIRPEDIPQICEGYDILAKEMLARKKQGKGFNFFHYMIDLSGGPCVYKRLSGCGSGTEYLAVTPWGDLYPCHQFVGEEQFCLGNVDDGVVNTDMRDTFKLCNVYAKRSVGTALPNSTAAVAAQQMLITATVTLTNRMKPAVNCSANVWNVRLCSRQQKPMMREIRTA